MTERLEGIVSAIETIADEFINDFSKERSDYWNRWFSENKSQGLKLFSDYQSLLQEYPRHPAKNKMLYGSGNYEDDSFLELSQKISIAKEEFYKFVLPLMIRDTEAREIQDKITEVDRSIEYDGRHYLVTRWDMLHENKELNDEAWAHIGKTLTYRLFFKVHNEDNRGKGRPKKHSNDKVIFIARRIIALKKLLYAPFYQLAPFSDVDIVAALQSNPKNEVLKAVMKNIGISNAISCQRVCNMISAGRQELEGHWLIENPVDYRRSDDFLRLEDISIEDRIKYAEQDLGSLTDEDKGAIRQGFSCPTEIKQFLLRDDLREVDLETVILWKLMPDQISEIVAYAKNRFGLSKFKNVHAEKKARDYW